MTLEEAKAKLEEALSSLADPHVIVALQEKVAELEAQQ